MMLLLCTTVQILLVPIVFGSSNPRVAIIGGGIGGATCAHFLRKDFQDDVSITLFERDDIGGRLATINIDGEDYEAGGSVILPKNKYMADFTELLGLKQNGPLEDLWGIFNGEKFLFQDSEWSFISKSKLYWRYGLDMFRINSFISSLFDEFSNIYEQQDKGIAYTTVTSLLQDMNTKFPNMTQETLRSYMKANSFSDAFLDEFIGALTLMNYGQTLDLNAFVGTLQIVLSGLWNVQGGNQQVPSGLIAESKSEVINAEVLSVTLLENEDFELAYREEDSNVVLKREFDFVAVATPLMEDHTNIQFHNFPKAFNGFFKPFQRTVTTYVQGKLDTSVFKSDSVPDLILINNHSFIVNSIEEAESVMGKSDSDNEVYKVFSKLPLTEDQVDILFNEVKTVKAKDWMAYPYYSTPEEIPPFVLHPNLFYTVAMEFSASAIEMSAVGGRNVALLIYNTWSNKLDLIDPSQKQQKDEL